MGTAVRPAGRPPRQEHRSANAADRRRRRRCRLDPDPAGPATHRSRGGGHRIAAGIDQMVPRSRSPRGGRSQQAAEGADRETEAAAGALDRKPDRHRAALSGSGRYPGAARQVRPDRRSGHAERLAAQGQGRLAALGIDVHPLVVPDRRHDRAASPAQRCRQPDR